MTKKNQHVVPTKDNKWEVKGEGNQCLTKKTDTHLIEMCDLVVKI